MSRADELAYMTATELAARIRRRELSPVEVVDATHRAHRGAQPEPQRVRLHGLRRRARARAGGRGGGRCAARRSARCTACRRRSRTCSTSSRAGRRPSAASARCKDFVLDTYCAFAERDREGRRDPRRQDQQPGHGLPRHLRQLPVRADAQPVRHSPGTPAARRAAAPAAVADGLLPLAEGTDGGGSIRIPASWCGVYGFKPSFGRVPFVAAAERLRRDQPVPLRGADHAHGRGCRARADRARRLRPARPVLRSTARWTSAAATRALDRRAARSPTARLRRLPGRPARRRAVRRRGGRGLRGGGRARRGGRARITRTQRELTDLWCRLIIAAQRRRARELQGRRHRPARATTATTFRRSTCAGSSAATGMTARRRRSATRRCAPRSSTRVQGVLADYDLLVRPTLACLPVDNADDGNTDRARRRSTARRSTR